MTEYRVPSERRKLDGKWLCRWCGKPCSGRRSSWCSDKCHKEGTWVWKSPRANVDRRAKVCEVCSFNAERAEARLERLFRRLRAPYRHEPRETEVQFARRMAWKRRVGKLVARLENAGFKKCFRRVPWSPWFQIASSLWEADHIKPRVLGGHDAPSNLRVLCVPCHKAATRRLARYRKHRRRKNLDLYAPEDFV